MSSPGWSLQEVVKCAAAEALREHRAESRLLSADREALRFFARYFARSKGDTDAALQWMDLVQI